MKRKITGIMISMVVCSFLFCSCETLRLPPILRKKPKGEPPPHAPAHGYRHKHRDGSTLIFDNDLGVYKIKGSPEHYHADGYFYHREGNDWKRSKKMKGPWKPVKKKTIPPGLRR